MKRNILILLFQCAIFLLVGHLYVFGQRNVLEDGFNSIVGQMANYKWEINDGVVDIFPTRGRDER